MAKSAKKYIKSKSAPNAAGPGFRTSDHFLASQSGRGSMFGGGKSKFSGGKSPTPKAQFNPGQFKVQHKG